MTLASARPIGFASSPPFSYLSYQPSPLLPPPPPRARQARLRRFLRRAAAGNGAVGHSGGGCGADLYAHSDGDRRNRAAAARMGAGYNSWVGDVCHHCRLTYSHCSINIIRIATRPPRYCFTPRSLPVCIIYGSGGRRAGEVRRGLVCRRDCDHGQRRRQAHLPSRGVLCCEVPPL